MTRAPLPRTAPQEQDNCRTAFPGFVRLPAGSAPTGITSAFGSIRVASPRSKWLNRIEPQTGQITTQIDLGSSATRGLYSCGPPVATSAAVWVHACANSGVTAVDPTNNQVIGHLDAGGVLNSDADTWACASDNQHLIKVDPATRRVRDVLAVDLGAHRRLPVDRDDDVKPVTPAPVPAMQRVGDGRLAWREAWDRRRADLAELGGVADELTAVDRRVDDLNRRAAALLADHADVVLE